MASAQQKPVDQAVKKTARAVEQQSRKVADQAAEGKQAATRSETSADRTTQLAADRNVLAAERTYAAWVRTGLFALASGIGARALLHGLLKEWLVLADSTMLIALSIFCCAAAIWSHLEPGPLVLAPKLGRIPGLVFFKQKTAYEI